MTLDSALGLIQNFRSQLDQWGITQQFLILAGVLALALFLWSLREIMAWYLKLNQIHDEMRDLSTEVRALKLSVQELRETLKEQAELAPPVPLKPTEAPPQFRLDH